MRLVLAVSLVLSVGGAAAQAAGDIPLWIYLISTVLGTGFGGKWILDRRDKAWGERLQEATAAATEQTARKTSVETAQAMEGLQTSILQRARAEHAELSKELETVRRQLSDAMTRLSESEAEAARKRLEWRSALDEKERRMAIMRNEIIRLQDEVAAWHQGQHVGKRRRDDPQD